MPIIHPHNQKRFNSDSQLFERDYEGNGIFDSIVSGVKTASDFASKNKDLFSAAASLGNAASSIAQAVKSKQELDKIIRIKEQRRKLK